MRMKNHGAKIFFHAVAAVDPAPGAAAVVAAVKPITSGNEKGVGVMRRNAHHVTILINSGDPAHRTKGLGFAFAHVAPTFAGIEALNHAAFLD